MNTTSSAVPACVATLYGDHHTWLQSWLRRRLGNAADAADLAQDAFVRLLRRPPRFETTLQARVYLRAMAQGLCVDLWRRRAIEMAWLDELAAQPERVALSAQDHVAVLQALQEIDRLMQGLSARAAQAFVLAQACGMTDREVAEQLGVSTRMVRKYVAQAMLLCLQLEVA